MYKVMVQLAELMKDKSYPDSGRELYAILLEAISTKTRVEINMAGVDALPSMFLNTSLGPLIKDKGLNLLKESFKLLNVSRTQIERIKKYFDNYPGGRRN